MKPFDCLVFDIAGTVFDWRADVANVLATSFGLDDDESAALAKQWRVAVSRTIGEISRKEIEFRPFDRILADTLVEIARSDDLGDPIGPALKNALMTAWERMPVWPDAPEGIARLRESFIVAPHTALSLRLGIAASRRNRVDWDTIISCDLLGTMKPERASYEKAFQALGQTPDRICYVASHVGDLEAARAAGTRTAYVRNRYETGPADADEAARIATFDFRANDFGELADAVLNAG